MINFHLLTPGITPFFTKTLSLLLLSGLCLAELHDELISDSFYKSYQYEQVGDYTNAINALLMKHKKHPDDYTLNIRLGYLYFNNKKYANAISHYRSANKLALQAIPPQLGLMRVMNTQNRYLDAEVAGYKILQSDYYNYYANLYLGYALRMSEKWDLAVNINLKMLALYPSDTAFLLEYSLLTFAQGDYIASKQALGYLLLLEPENVVAKETLQKINA